MDFLGREGSDALGPFMSAPILLGLDGRAYTLEQINKHAAADGRLFVEHEVTPLVTRVLEQGSPVILIDSEHETTAEQQDPMRLGPVTRVLANSLAREFKTTHMIAKVLQQIGIKHEFNAWIKASELITRPERVLVAVEEAEDDLPAKALVERADAILAAGVGRGPSVFARALARLQREPPKIGFRRLVCARLHGARGGAYPLFVVAHEVAPLMAIPTPDMLVSDRAVRPEAAVNIEHPHFRALLQIARDQPAIAGYCLAKALLLDRDRGLEFDEDLIQAALA